MASPEAVAFQRFAVEEYGMLLEEVQRDVVYDSPNQVGIPTHGQWRLSEVA